MRIPLLLSILATWGSGLLAEVRHEVVGDTLIFNMTIEEPEFEFTKGVESYGVTAITTYMFEYPEIRKLKITGPGGDVSSGTAIGAKPLTYVIDTEAYGECFSACAKIFLAGRNRILAPNSTLGFHRHWIDKESEKKFYEANRVEEDWADEFDYVTWVYEDAIKDVIEEIRFMRSRGVKMDFILKAFSTSSSDMWEPTREELHEPNTSKPAHIIFQNLDYDDFMNNQDLLKIYKWKPSSAGKVTKSNITQQGSISPQRRTNYKKPNETERKGLVTSRIGQGYYLQQIIEKWNGKCAVSKTDILPILIASHIVPWSESNDDERLDVENGILLSPLYDALFDKYLISFDARSL